MPQYRFLIIYLGLGLMIVHQDSTSFLIFDSETAVRGLLIGEKSLAGMLTKHIAKV